MRAARCLPGEERDLQRFDRLTYTIGNEHNPTDPVGRFVLVLERQGAAVVDHHARTGHTHHRGQASPEAVARLDAALVGCGFPEHRRPPFVVPDSAICTIEIERAGETQWLSAAERDLRPQPGYAELLDGLEELGRAITGSPPAR